MVILWIPKSGKWTCLLESKVHLLSLTLNDIRDELQTSWLSKGFLCIIAKYVMPLAPAWDLAKGSDVGVHMSRANTTCVAWNIVCIK